MALVEWDKGPELHASLPDIRVKLPEEGPAPNFFSETLPVAFRQSNVIGSYIANRAPITDTLDPWEVEEGFNVFDYIREKHGQEYEDAYGDRYIETVNRKYADALHSQILMESEDRKTLDSAGLAGMIAETFAAVLDPTSLIPGGPGVKSARVGRALLSPPRLTLAAYLGGGTAARVGAAGGAAAAVSEAALHGSQVLRTPEESALAVAGSALLSAMMGGTIGVLMSRAARDAA